MIYIIFTVIIISCQFIPLVNVLNYEFSVLTSCLVFLVMYIYGHYRKPDKFHYKRLLIFVFIPFIISVYNTFWIKECASSRPVLYLLIVFPAAFLGLSCGIFSSLCFNRKIFRLLLFIFITIIISIQSIYLGVFKPTFVVANIVSGFISFNSFYGFGTNKILLPDYFFLQRIWVIAFALCLKYFLFFIFHKKLNKVEGIISKKKALVKFTLLLIFVTFFLFKNERLGFDGREKYLNKVMQYCVESDNFIFYTDKDYVFNNNIDKIADQLEFHYYILCNKFNIKPERKIKVYLYSSPKIMEQLVGEKYLLYVKPPIGQIHFTYYHWPSQVIRHEIVHALSEEFSSNIFKVPLNFGLVEGLAVGFEDDSSIKDREITMAAALKNKHLTPLDEVFSIIKFGFGKSPARKNYQIAGAFITFLKDNYSIENIKKWYYTNNFERSYGKSLRQVEKEWHSYLKKIKIPETRNERIKKYYDDVSHPPFYKKRCMRLGILYISIENPEYKIFNKGFPEQSIQSFEKLYKDTGDTEWLFKKGVFLNTINRIDEASKVFSDILNKKISYSLRQKTLENYLNTLFYLKNWQEIPKRLNELDIFIEEKDKLKIQEYNFVLADTAFRETFHYIFLKPEKYKFELLKHSKIFSDNVVFKYFYFKGFLHSSYYLTNDYTKLHEIYQKMNPYDWISELHKFHYILSSIIEKGIKINYFAGNLNIVNQLLLEWNPPDYRSEIIKKEWAIRIDWQKNNPLKIKPISVE